MVSFIRKDELYEKIKIRLEYDIAVNVHGIFGLHLYVSSTINMGCRY
jgi:hypothetical protein